MDQIKIDELSENEKNYWWSYGKRKLVIEFIKKYILNKNNIIDIGCNAGEMLVDLKKFGNCFGLENNFSAFLYCQNKNIQNIICGDAENLPIKNNKFDIALALDVIEHLDDDVKFVNEIKNILTKSGFIILTVPAYQFMWSEKDINVMHKRRYNKRQITELLTKNGFNIVRCTYYNMFFFPVQLLFILINKISKTHKPYPFKSEIIKVPFLLNELFKFILLVERNILLHVNFFTGSSIVIVARLKQN